MLNSEEDVKCPVCGGMTTRRQLARNGKCYECKEPKDIDIFEMGNPSVD